MLYHRYYLARQTVHPRYISESTNLCKWYFLQIWTLVSLYDIDSIKLILVKFICLFSISFKAIISEEQNTSLLYHRYYLARQTVHPRYISESTNLCKWYFLQIWTLVSLYDIDSIKLILVKFTCLFWFDIENRIYILQFFSMSLWKNDRHTI